MEITLTISGTATPETLAAILEALNGKAKVASTPAPVKSLNKAKPKPDEAEDEDLTGDGGESEVTLASITKLVKKKISEGETEAVKALLKKFKAPKASDLDEEHYSDFYEKLKAL